MIEGISKERLLEIKFTRTLSYASKILLQQLIDECTELAPWLSVDDFLSAAETQGYKNFCQLRQEDGEVLMGWFNYSIGMFYQCFPTGFEPLNAGVVITHVLPLTTHYKLLQEDLK